MVRGEDMDIPRTYATVPDGFADCEATEAEVEAAGFRGAGPEKPGQQPLDEMIVEDGEQMLPIEVVDQVMRQARHRVLRDPHGEIVATWDEGRWWTPSESGEFTRRLVAEMTAPPPMNRRERRQRGGA